MAKRKFKKKTPAQRKAKSDKLCADITEKVITAIALSIETGEPLLWRQTWKGGGSPLQPHNGASGHRYSGVNILLLAFAGYGDGRWYTYNQVSKMQKKDADGVRTGPHVRKGEKSTTIVYVNLIKRDKEGPDGELVDDSFSVQGTHAVFNREQCDGWPAELREAGEEEEPVMVLDCEKALALRDASECPIHHAGGRAFYRPSTDEITVPEPEKFEDQRAYWATLFHEMAHSTGHKSRLDRDLSGSFSKEKYAKEELVAELAAAFLCAEVGVVQAGAPDENHTAYLRSWLKALKDDTRLILTAASKAQKASDRILGTVSKGEGAADDEAEQAA